MYSPNIPLNVREITLGNSIGNPNDPSNRDTVIGLLKRIVSILG